MRLSVTRTAKICPIVIAASISRPTLHLALPVRQHNFTSDHIPRNYNLLLPAALALAHLALMAAARAALAAAEKCFLAFFTGLVAPALACAAILFATPARMLASPWALIFRFLGAGAGSIDGVVPLIFAHLAF